MCVHASQLTQQLCLHHIRQPGALQHCNNNGMRLRLTHSCNCAASMRLQHHNGCACPQGNRLVRFSRREVIFRQVASKYGRGDLVDGVVTSVQKYGAFVDIGDGLIALLHISQITQEWLSTVEQVF
jgi:hypothetical protein